jgi:hypothetical protein
VGAELDARQQGGHGGLVSRGQRIDIGVGKVGAVINTGRTQLYRELDARPGSELIAMHP